MFRPAAHRTANEREKHEQWLAHRRAQYAAMRASYNSAEQAERDRMVLGLALAATQVPAHVFQRMERYTRSRGRKELHKVSSLARSSEYVAGRLKVWTWLMSNGFSRYAAARITGVATSTIFDAMNGRIVGRRARQCSTSRADREPIIPGIEE